MKKPTFGPTKPCTVLGFSVENFHGTDVGINLDEIFYDVVNLAEIPYRMVNCSIKFIHGIKLGSKLKSGSWDGAIGFLERGEVNATPLGYPIGTIDDAPFHVGSVFWSTELSIVSMKPEAKNITVGIESWGKIFDHHTYAYLFLSIILFSLWYVVSLAMNQFTCDCIKSDRIKLSSKKTEKLFQIKTKKKQKRKKNVMNRLIKRGLISFPLIVWNSMLALINEQLITPHSSSSKILLTTFLVAIFNLIIGFFCNSISVDMVAIQPVPMIDTLKQLIYDYKDVDVVTVGGLWQEGALKGSHPDSLERHLADRILAENYIPIVFDTGLVERIFKHILNSVEGKDVFIIDRQTIPAALSSICQAAEYIDISRIHVSHDMFGERLLVPMISLSSDNELLNWSRYKIRQLFEGYMFQNMVRDTYKTITVDQSVSLFKKIVCIEGRKKSQESDPPNPFQLNFFIPLIMICLKIIILALILLIGEITISFLKRTAKKLLK